MKNVFYFMLKVLFVLEIFIFLSWLFAYVEKPLYKKAEVKNHVENDAGRLLPDLFFF